MKQNIINRLARIESCKEAPGGGLVEILNHRPGLRYNGRIYESFKDIPFGGPGFWLIFPEQYDTVEEWEAANRDGRFENPAWKEWEAMSRE